jgi:hypothetical protein
LANLFDGSNDTKWCGNINEDGVIQIMFRYRYVNIFEEYSLISANDSEERDPASWTLYGSNDGFIYIYIFIYLFTYLFLQN